MPPLSSPLWTLEPRYEVVIIGSGYGGAIAANRLARARRPDGTPISVCVLERGNEIATGEFPDRPGPALAQVTLDAPDARRGAENGLYHLHLDDELVVLQGRGLGGTSLINAGVGLEPEARVYDDLRWPRAIRDDTGGRLRAGFEHARAMLGVTPYPDRPPHGQLRKYQALEAAAGAGAKVFHPPLAITFDAAVNHAGIHQPACTGCGDCVSGCNIGAKNTLARNYLPDARNHGAQIFCGLAVRSVARRGTVWAVTFVPVGHHRELYDAPELAVLASTVIVSAGSLGSTEILLRSKQRGLSCSDQLGHRFTGNGDVLGFAYNGGTRVNAIGRGRQTFAPEDAPGPTITGIVDRRDGDGLLIADGTLPSPMKGLLPAAFGTAPKVTADDPGPSWWESVKQTLRELLSSLTSFAGGAYRGSIANTLPFLATGDDDDDGQITLEGDRPRVRWGETGRRRLRDRVAGKLQQLATASGASYVASPRFSRELAVDRITVSPLGGCVLADTAAAGVVNERGQVFDRARGDGTHAGLYVMDGSIIPRPLGVHPLLTIAALAERNVRLLVEDRGWQLDDRATPTVFDGVREQPRPITLQFSERMTGHVTPAATEDFAAAADEARRRNHTVTAIFGILCPDLDAMIADPDRAARLIGTVQLAALSPDPMTIFDGHFNMFVIVGGDRSHKRMRYRMGLCALDGRRYHLDGFKEVHDDRGLDVYADTTTLFTTVRAGNDAGPIVARGILTINAADVVQLMRTMVARGHDGEPSLVARARFGKLFAGDLWEVYGLGEKLGIG